MSDATQQGADEEIKPSVNPRDAAIAQMAQSVHETIHAPDMHDFNEDTGEVIPRDEKGRFAPKEAVEEAPQEENALEAAPEPEAQPETPAQPAERKFKVKLYGEEKEVTEEELIRNYQIEEAARRNFEAAKAVKKQYEEALARIGQTTRLPDGQAVNDLRQDVGRPAIPPVDVISAIVRHEVEQNEAVAKFKSEYSDIANDPDFYQMAIAREDQRLWRVKNGIEADKPLAVALKEHGEAIRKKMARPSVSTTSANKLERKASVTNVPSASVRAPAPPQQKPLTLSEQIEQMRKMRGQPTA